MILVRRLAPQEFLLCVERVPTEREMLVIFNSYRLSSQILFICALPEVFRETPIIINTINKRRHECFLITEPQKFLKYISIKNGVSFTKYRSGNFMKNFSITLITSVFDSQMLLIVGDINIDNF